MQNLNIKIQKKKKKREILSLLSFSFSMSNDDASACDNLTLVVHGEEYIDLLSLVFS